MSEPDAEHSTNSLGMPSAEFIGDIDTFMSLDTNQENASLILRRLDEQHSKYKFMEMNLHRNKKTLQKQVSEMKSSLEMLSLIKQKRSEESSLVTHFQISEELYAKAIIPPTDKVCLWLGAGVMLEYSLPDAEDLLSRNIISTSKKLDQLDVDIDFLKDQFTTVEVNMSRVFNWDVKRRKQASRK